MNQNHPLRVIIFDCDGVMFDSRQANINFYNHVLARFDLPPMDPEEIHYVHMATGRDSVKHIFRKTSLFEEADAYRLQMDYAPFIKDMIIAPGLKDLLLKLQPEFHLAVATNRSNTIDEVLAQNDLNGLFDMVVSSLDVTNPKPHPESIFKILSFFEIAPDEAIYIGDSSVDYETARASKVCFVAYGNEELDAPFKVSTMMELEAVIGHFNGGQKTEDGGRRAED
ncbi:MAG: HAD family hydrolase [Deltaproteobacteria bacterium]|nr:HAD family hydrolase [Deltaproteobacteria bacterium]